jgi:hypothetical protein
MQPRWKVTLKPLKGGWTARELKLLDTEMRKPRADIEYLVRKTKRSKSAVLNKLGRMRKATGIHVSPTWEPWEIAYVRDCNQDWETVGKLLNRSPGAVMGYYYKLRREE